MSIADPNKIILTGENPFVRLSLKDGEPNSTDASYWRIIFSPAGPGHVLYLKSELTKGAGAFTPTTSRWRAGSSRPCKGCSMPNFPTQRSPVRTRSSPRREIPATSGLSTSGRMAKTSRSPGSISASRCSSTRSRTKFRTAATAYALC